jgi:hypothetical protein
MNINVFWCISSHVSNLNCYSKNLNAVAASRCPVRWIVVYNNNFYRKIHTDLDCKDQKIPQSLQPFDYSFHHPFYAISYSITQNFSNFNLPILQEIYHSIYLCLVISAICLLYPQMTSSKGNNLNTVLNERVFNGAKPKNNCQTTYL